MNKVAQTYTHHTYGHTSSNCKVKKTFKNTAALQINPPKTVKPETKLPLLYHSKKLLLFHLLFMCIYQEYYYMANAVNIPWF